MSKLVAIDYGAKRTGIAETDDLQIIASGLTTVETKELQGFMMTYLEKENVEVLVIGQAKRMNGELSEIEGKIVPFINFIKNRFPNLKIERQDEGFTSQAAIKAMIDGGLSKSKRRDKALVDKISATLILQRFMENR